MVGFNFLLEVGFFYLVVVFWNLGDGVKDVSFEVSAIVQLVLCVIFLMIEGIDNFFILT